MQFRIGYGEDNHRIAPGRPLILGGIHIDSPLGSLAHSDGDAVLHAIADALLSSLALGDIGDHFPDDDPANKNLNSRDILKFTLNMVTERGLSIVNLAIAITLDRPKLGPSRTEIARNIAEILEIPEDCVGMTFKTSEGLAEWYIQVRVSVLLQYR